MLTSLLNSDSVSKYIIGQARIYCAYAQMSLHDFEVFLYKIFRVRMKTTNKQ